MNPTTENMVQAGLAAFEENAEDEARDIVIKVYEAMREREILDLAPRTFIPRVSDLEISVKLRNLLLKNFGDVEVQDVPPESDLEKITGITRRCLREWREVLESVA